MTYPDDDPNNTLGTGDGPPVPWSTQPYPEQPWGPPRPTNGLAIASMVLGIIWIYWIGSILALIFGYNARKQIRERGEGGQGMAVAGIVLGWVGVGILCTGLLLSVIAYLTSPS